MNIWFYRVTYVGEICVIHCLRQLYSMDLNEVILKKTSGWRMFLYWRIVALSQCMNKHVMNLFGGTCDQNSFHDKIPELKPFERN